MDPELTEQLNNQFAQMNELLSQQNSLMAAQIKMMQSQQTAGKNLSNSLNAQSNATAQNAASATSSATKLREAEAKAGQTMEAVAGSFKKAVDATSGSLLSFGAAIRDVSAGYSKYSSGISGLADGIGGLVSNFGILGKVTGGLISGLGKAAGVILDYNDALLKGYDSLGSFGAGAGLSAEKIMKLGHQADLSSETLQYLTNSAKEISRSLVSMGGSFTQGVEAFSKYIDVGDKQLRQYRNLGIQQDELIEAMKRYADIQAKTGNSMVQTPKQLQKASLAYIDNLLTLAELTGVDIKKMQDAQDQALAQENFNAYIFRKQQERAEAEAKGDGEKVKQLDAIIKAKEEYAATAYATLDAASAAARVQSIATDGAVVFTDTNAMLLQGQSEIEEHQRRMMQGENQTMALMEDNADIQNRLSDRYSFILESTGKVGAEFANQIGASKENRESANQINAIMRKYGKEMQNMSAEEREAFLRKKRAEAQAELDKTKDKTTGATADDATRQSLERQLRIMKDEFVDPLAAAARKLINEGLEKAVQAFTALNDFLNNDLMPTLRNLKEFFESLPTSIKILGAALIGLAGVGGLGLLKSAITGTAGLLTKTFGGALKGITSILGWMGNKIKSLFGFGDAGAGPGAPGKKTPGPKQDASGRWRDSKGKFTTAPVKGGKMLGLAKGLAGGLGSLLGGLALDYGAEKAEEAGYKKTAAGLSTGSSALTGAGLGASVGSIIPGVGTVVGGALGGLLGGAYGLYQNWGSLTGAADEELSPEQEKLRVETKTNVDKVSESAAKNVVSSDQTERSSVTFTKAINKFNEHVLLLTKFIDMHSKSVKDFNLGVGSFKDILKDFKNYVDNNLLGGYGTQFGGDTDQILATIRQRESGGDYKAQAKGSSASGAYQFIDSTWQSLTKKYNLGTEYKRAADAPAAIQDQVAAAYVQDILKQAGGDVSKVPLAWYTGNIQGKMSKEAMAANNGLTPQMYQKKWMEDFAKTKPTGYAAGSQSSDIVAIGNELLRQGFFVEENEAFGGVKGKHQGKGHKEGRAIDVNAIRGDDSKDPEAAAKMDALAKQLSSNPNLTVLWRTSGHNDHMHIETKVKAAKGGVFTGPGSGYPATLHGTEMVAPLNTDSVLMKLAKTPINNIRSLLMPSTITRAESFANVNAEEILKTVAKSTPDAKEITEIIAKSMPGQNDDIRQMVAVNSELISMLSSKLDEVIDVLDQGNDTRKKMFKHSVA